MFRLVLIVAGLATSIVASVEQASARAQAYGSQELIRLRANRPCIMVAINGYGMFPFMLDTATSHTVLVPWLSEKLAIPATSGPSYSVVTAAGSVRSHFHVVKEVAASGVIVEGLHAVVIDLPRELGVMGILGADFLSNFTVDLDLMAQKVTLYPEGTVLHPTGFHRLRGTLNSAGFIVVPARVENLLASAVLDSGALSTVANPKLAAYTRHRSVTTIARNIESKVVDVAGQRGQAENYTFDRISLGLTTWRDRQIKVANMRVFEQIGLDGHPAIFIGMDFLAGRRVILDYANASLYLAP